MRFFLLYEKCQQNNYNRTDNKSSPGKIKTHIRYCVHKLRRGGGKIYFFIINTCIKQRYIILIKGYSKDFFVVTKDLYLK